MLPISQIIFYYYDKICKIGSSPKSTHVPRNSAPVIGDNWNQGNPRDCQGSAVTLVGYFWFFTKVARSYSNPCDAPAANESHKIVKISMKEKKSVRLFLGGLG